MGRAVPVMSSHGPGSLATQCPGPLCPPRVLPRVGTTSRVASESVTPPSSLLWAHAPDQIPPRASDSSLYTRSLQVVAVSPCWGDGPSRRYLCDPCVGARTHTPPHSSAACVRCLTEDAGLTPRETGSTRGFTPTQQLRWGAVYRGCSHSITFGLLRSLDLQVAPTAAPKGTEPPGLSHHAEPGRLPDPGSGVASCPTRTTDTAGLSPAGSQPCRLLLPAHGLPMIF